MNEAEKDLQDLYKIINAIYKADNEEEVVDAVLWCLSEIECIRYYIVNHETNNIVETNIVGNEGLIMKDCLKKNVHECTALQTGIKMVFQGDKGCGKITLDRAWSCMCVPLFYQDSKAPYVTHIFTLISKDIEFFTGRMREKIEAVFNCASLSIRRIRMINQCKENTIRDYLTGLYNRRFLDERLKFEFMKTCICSHQLSVLMIDIDYFKNINDTYGHKVGDLTLLHVANLLKASIRTSDIVARYGGEEFAVVLPDTTKNDAFEIAERIRSTIEQSALDIEGKQLKITASFGLATYDDDKVESTERLLKLADERLYKAKKSGKNKVVKD
ncbi:MAG TPA: GGDEF domain-containing protein [Thermodesulfobium narugense]|nr:GGDEF domain-containing protein [Thermodesulfobium narugense]